MTIKKIIFLRPAPYIDTIPGHDLITSFELTGLRQAEPGVSSFSKETVTCVEKIKKTYLPEIVYTSPSSRTLTTAQVFGLPIKIDQNLTEILFSLKESVPGEVIADPEKININTLRVELMRAFSKGNTREKPESVTERMNTFYQEVLSRPEKTILCISHAFVMKCYELFYQSNRMITSPAIFSEGYDWNSKPYGFLDGFVVLIDEEGKIKIDAL